MSAKETLEFLSAVSRTMPHLPQQGSVWVDIEDGLKYKVRIVHVSREAISITAETEDGKSLIDYGLIAFYGRFDRTETPDE